MTQIVERTVLFADLRGSTSMYETLGNADATAVVTQSVSLLARIVINHGGRVVKTLGDGLMAMFTAPDSAVAAADEMHDSLERIGAPGDGSRVATSATMGVSSAAPLARILAHAHRVCTRTCASAPPGYKLRKP